MRPTAQVWRDTKARDREQCARCGTRYGLSHQHRRAVGMGGSKIPPLIEDSLVLCLGCNVRCEADLQMLALVFGWKVRRWVGDPALAPVFYPHFGGWKRLTESGEAINISATEAEEMMRALYGPQWDEWRSAVGAQTTGKGIAHG